MSFGVWQILLILIVLGILFGIGVLIFGGLNRKTRLKYIGVWFLYVIPANIISWGVSKFLTSDSRIRWTFENYWIEGPLIVLCFTVSATVIYSLFKSLDKSRVVPWFYGLHILGLLSDIVRTEKTNDFFASEYGLNTTSWYVSLIVSYIAHMFWFHWFFVIRVRNKKSTQPRPDTAISYNEPKMSYETKIAQTNEKTDESPDLRSVGLEIEENKIVFSNDPYRRNQENAAEQQAAAAEKKKQEEAARRKVREEQERLVREKAKQQAVAAEKKKQEETTKKKVGEEQERSRERGGLQLQKINNSELMEKEKQKKFDRLIILHPPSKSIWEDYLKIREREITQSEEKKRLLNNRMRNAIATSIEAAKSELDSIEKEIKKSRYAPESPDIQDALDVLKSNRSSVKKFRDYILDVGEAEAKKYLKETLDALMSDDNQKSGGLDGEIEKNKVLQRGVEKLENIFGKDNIRFRYYGNNVSIYIKDHSYKRFKEVSEIPKSEMTNLISSIEEYLKNKPTVIGPELLVSCVQEIKGKISTK